MAGVLLLADHLSGRCRRDGSHPLVTYYDVESGERTELSATSFGNWVDKTANFIVDELGLGAGDTIALPLLQTRPGHWVTLVWAMAVWQAGVALVINEEDADAHVVGPEGVNELANQLVACSLHPLGLGFSTELPPSVIDYGVEVRSQPDVWLGAPAAAVSPAWRFDGSELSQADLTRIEVPLAQRRLITPGEAWETLRDALVAPVIAGGSSVIVAGEASEEQLAKLAEDELAVRN